MLRFTPNGTKAAALGWLIVLFMSFHFASFRADGQTKRGVRPNAVKTPPAAARSAAVPVKVTLVNEVTIKKILQPNGKPLLINFWATWCDPCREEFPDLVKIDNEFKGKIDFITISLDDPEEIATTVPKFLASMKAEMPAYLLKTADESSVITSISKDWQGGMPFTVLFASNGDLAYSRQGLIKIDTVRQTLAGLINRGSQGPVELSKFLSIPAKPTFDDGVVKAKSDFAKGEYFLLRYGLTPAIPLEHLRMLKRKYRIVVSEFGCLVPAGYDQYVLGYNEIMIAKLIGKFGQSVIQQVRFAPVRNQN